MQPAPGMEVSIGQGHPMARWIKHAPTILTVGMIVILALHGRIAQPSHYNEFADQSAAFGIPHAADVFSNAGFALVAIWGWLTLRPRRASDHLRAGWPGYRLFLIGLFLTAFGSAFYHLAPDNARLIWDRLPIALVCAGLLAGVRGDIQVGSRTGFDVIVLGLYAVASVAWWAITDRNGASDLRPYLLLQGLLSSSSRYGKRSIAPRAPIASLRHRDGAVHPGQGRRGARPRDRERFRFRHRTHLETSDRDGSHGRNCLGIDPTIFA